MQIQKYNKNNCIPELLMAKYGVVDSELLFLLSWNGVNICTNHRSGLSVINHSRPWFISYKLQFEPLIWGVKVLHI